MRLYPYACGMSIIDLRVLSYVARRAPGGAAKARARALTPGQRRRRRRLDPVRPNSAELRGIRDIRCVTRLAERSSGLFVPKPSCAAGYQRCSTPGLRQTVRACPLASTAVGGDCHSLRHSVARVAVVSDCCPPHAFQVCRSVFTVGRRRLRPAVARPRVAR